MTASLALFAGLPSSAEAFPFDWPPRPDLRRQDFARHDIAEHREAGRMLVAAREKSDKAKPAVKDELASKAKGVLTVAISIDKQHLTLYSDGVPIAHSHVSTGMPGHPTPTGVFSVIQKDRYHHSNIYSGAPMPFMQRITWSGVAMHEGVVPNHPASHGCIRLPGAFARQLWGLTKLGVRVFVTHGEVTPTEIADGRLFTFKPPADPPVNVADTKPVETPSGATPDGQQSSVPPEVKPGDPALDAMAYARLSPSESKAPAAQPAASANLAPVPPTAAAPATKPLRPGPISVFISRKEGKLFVRKGFEPVFDTAVTFEDPDRPLGTHVFTALALNDDNTLRWNVVTVPGGWAKPAGKRKKGEPPPAPPAAASTASEALARVNIPADAVDRVSQLMSAGASLIISDQGLGPETGKGTDFIVLTR